MLTVKLKGANHTIATGNMRTKIYITLHSDNSLEIRDSGASVYDYNKIESIQKQIFNLI